MHYQPQKNLLQNRIILVTGASDGIGREAALTFADYGASVILIGRNEENSKEWLRRLTPPVAFLPAGTRWICSPVPLKRARSLPTASAPTTHGWMAYCTMPACLGGSPDG